MNTVLTGFYEKKSGSAIRSGILAFLATFQSDDIDFYQKKSCLAMNQGNAGVFWRNQSNVMKIQQNAGVFCWKWHENSNGALVVFTKKNQDQRSTSEMPAFGPGINLTL